MSAEAFGLWSAIAIHDTSSVVGAAMTHGEAALEIATTVKLSRALWIVPVTLVLAWRTRRRVPATPAPEEARPARPWFIAGFVAVAVLFTALPALQPVGELVSAGARRLMVVSLFLIGASMSRGALRRVGWAAFAQGVALWIAISIASLAVILLLV
jgi:uncharacterized membrane protein YadS